MASIGPRFPATAASLANAGTSENAEAWVNPTNVFSDNATEAAITAATYDTPDISQILVASNFGFTVPAGAVINGIIVEIDRRSIIASSGKDFRVQLAKGTTFASLVGSNLAVPATIWPTTTGIATYGGAANLWGATWDANDINATSFAVFVSCQANIANADVGIDFIRVTVHYTLAVEGSASLSGVGSFSASAEVERRASFSPGGIGSFGATAGVDRNAAASFAGVGGFSVAAVVEREPVTGTASLVGSSAFSAAATVERLAGASLAGVGGFGASGQVDRQATVNLAAQGVLTASALVERRASLAVAGAGEFGATGSVDRNASAAFAGVGSLTIDVAEGGDVFGSLDLQAFGSFAVTPTVERNAAVMLAASSGFAASGSIERNASVALAGAGVLAVNPSLELVSAAAFIGSSAFAVSGSSAADVPLTIAIAKRIAALLEPEAVAGQMIEQVFGWHVIIDDASIGAHSEPFMYAPGVLHVWESGDRRSFLSSDGFLQHSFEFTVAIGFDDGGEEARMQGGDRALQEFIDAKTWQYVDAIRHNQQTDEWDYASSVVMPDFLTAFGLRGFALRVTGYRLE